MLKLTLFLLLTSILGQALVASLRYEPMTEKEYYYIPVKGSDQLPSVDYEFDHCIDERFDCEENAMRYPNFCSENADYCKRTCGVCSVYDCYDEKSFDCENNVLIYPNFCSEYKDYCQITCGSCSYNGGEYITPCKL